MFGEFQCCVEFGEVFFEGFLQYVLEVFWVGCVVLVDFCVEFVYDVFVDVGFEVGCEQGGFQVFLCCFVDCGFDEYVVQCVIEGLGFFCYFFSLWVVLQDG